MASFWVGTSWPTPAHPVEPPLIENDTSLIYSSKLRNDDRYGNIVADIIVSNLLGLLITSNTNIQTSLL
jgi:hypothetical protein